MPGALIDRPKMTKTMYQALKRHIMKERERKKQGILYVCRWKEEDIAGNVSNTSPKI